MSAADQCEGKERYATPALAHKAAKRRNRRGRNLDVYRCNICSGFHHGTRIRTATKLWKRRESVIE